MGPSTTVIDPHAPASLSLWTAMRSAWTHRALLRQMTLREVVGRYRGSVMGVAWSFLHPLLMLAIYTFVFSEVFKARWTPTGGEQKAEFALLLFIGMIVLNFVNEVLSRTASLIPAHANFVKKVVFPLENLPVVTVAAAAFHALVSLAVLLLATFAVQGSLHASVLLVPLMLVPLACFALGFGWVFAALGVYLRDLVQTVAVLTAALMFLSPVFYPVSAVPAPFRSLMLLNPLTFMIEQLRGAIVWGQLPDAGGWAVYSLVGLLVAWAGFACFQSVRRGFADVL